jgi:hypothetical protein
MLDALACDARLLEHQRVVVRGAQRRTLSTTKRGLVEVGDGVPTVPGCP